MRRHMQVFSAAFLVALCATAKAEKRVVLIGKPIFRVISYPGVSEKEVLTPSQQEEFRLLITKIDGSDEYILESREQKALVGFQSGVYTHFLGHGSAWVKVGDVSLIKEQARTVAESGVLQSMTSAEFVEAMLKKNFIPAVLAGSRYVYFEVTTQGMMVAVYWGTAEEFSP